MPNEIPGNAGFLVHTNMAPVIAGVTGAATTLGRGMLPNTAVPLLEGGVMQVWGRGTWDLDEPNVPPLDVRFTRGPRLNGVRGTLDVYTTLGVDGTARTICYLTDNPVLPTNVIALRVDAQNRALLALTQGVLPPTEAGGRLVLTANATNTEDVTIDAKVYTFEAALTDVDGNIQIGATAAETLDNLMAAINLEPWGAGSAYAASMTLHPTASAYRDTGDVLVAESKQLGTVGNAIATTENMLSGSWSNGATMVDGSDGNLTTEALVTPSGSAVPSNAPAHLRMTWDSENMLPGVHRHASFSINGEPIPAVDWGTDPITPWAKWQPTHLVLGAGLGALYLEPDFNGVIRAAQVSNLVLP